MVVRYRRLSSKILLLYLVVEQPSFLQRRRLVKVRVRVALERRARKLDLTLRLRLSCKETKTEEVVGMWG